MAQQGARRAHNPEVGGSKPSVARLIFGLLRCELSLGVSQSPCPGYFVFWKGALAPNYTHCMV